MCVFARVPIGVVVPECVYMLVCVCVCVYLSLSLSVSLCSFLCMRACVCLTVFVCLLQTFASHCYIQKDVD